LHGVVFIDDKFVFSRLGLDFDGAQGVEAGLLVVPATAAISSP
jgi:hypothetical protein